MSHKTGILLQCNVLRRTVRELSCLVFMQALVAAAGGNGALPAGHGVGRGRAAAQDAAEAAKDAIDAKDGAEASQEAGVDAASGTAMAEASDKQIDGPKVPEVSNYAMAELPQDAMAEASDSMVDGPEVPKGAAVAQELTSDVAAVEAGTPGKAVGSASPEEDKPGWAS